MSRAQRNPTDKPSKPQIRNDILAQTGCAHGHVTSPAVRRWIPIQKPPSASSASPAICSRKCRFDDTLQHFTRD